MVPDEDLDFVVFPRERLGKTYELNWTICKYAVIPNKVRTRFQFTMKHAL